MRKRPLHPAYQNRPTYYRNFNPYFNQTFDQPFYPTGLGPYQTPFTQYAKPELPDDWYQGNQINVGYNHPLPKENMLSNFQPMMQGNPGTTQPTEENMSSGSTQPIQESPGNPQAIQGAEQNYPSMGPNGMNPYSFPKQPNNLLSQFQNTEGQLDVDKMINTVGQLASTYHQVAPIIKQFGAFIKNFR
ncbi:MAG TPA: YppG family protein [Candidatus Avamphibacillus sp.]|nr:YppG family protein [Candidatus Avamphibacillus sp.]